jgi:aminopeptidase
MWRSIPNGAAEIEVIDEKQLRRYALLVIEVATNVRPGQLVCINGFVEHAPLVRALTEAAYARSACYVDVLYADQQIRRALIAQGPDESLERTPRWTVERLAELGENEGALIMISGDPAPDHFDDLDSGRVVRQRMPAHMDLYLHLLATRRITWTWTGFPKPAWAQHVFGEPDIGRLCQAIVHVVRLDDPDPVTAWDEQMQRLRERATLLTERQFRRDPVSRARYLRCNRPDSRWEMVVRL